MRPVRFVRHVLSACLSALVGCGGGTSGSRDRRRGRHGAERRGRNAARPERRRRRYERAPPAPSAPAGDEPVRPGRAGAAGTAGAGGRGGTRRCGGQRRTRRHGRRWARRQRGRRRRRGGRRRWRRRGGGHDRHGRRDWSRAARAPTCKRGIATNTAPGAAFYPAVRWWYNWSLSRSGGNTGIEFVPMVWGSSTVSGTIPSGSKYLLGFNEPNFKAQSNLTPQAAADRLARAADQRARTRARSIVGPGMNFCGPAANCNGTDPYVYLTDFLAACTNCQVDHIAVHWYNCDLPSLRAYIESNASLAGWEQFGKPIWLTEFSCDGNATAAQQEAFMRAAIPYLESHPNVFRYSWFSADPIPNAQADQQRRLADRPRSGLHQPRRRTVRNGARRGRRATTGR